MQTDQHQKNLELERLVFFSDAIAAIAITLLALELKVSPKGAHLEFADIAAAWHSFAAFFLSFIIIAVFWVNHHRFFCAYQEYRLQADGVQHLLAAVHRAASVYQLAYQRRFFQ